MNYHIDTGLIYEKFKENRVCPFCAIEKIITEQTVYEFLNDAVMEDDTHILVEKKGFCAKHFGMMLARPNKLSASIQIGSNLNTLDKIIDGKAPFVTAKKKAEKIEKALTDCVICDAVADSMQKYYKTTAQMFLHEKEFYKLLLSCNGFCLKHYAELLRYSSCAGIGAKDYVSLLDGCEQRALNAVRDNLTAFNRSHDYRNAYTPLGKAEHALDDAQRFVYGNPADHPTK